MNKNVSVLIVVLIILFFGVAQVHAAGFGLYASLGGAAQEWNATNSSYTGYHKFDTDAARRGFGMALDTRLAGNTMFNYHMSLGYESSTVKDFQLVPYDISGALDAYVTDVKIKTVSWSHAFGFGGPLSPETRLWFGPEIRFEWAKGTTAPDIDVRMFGIGIGPTLGLNINFSNRFSLVLKTGYQFISYGANVSGNINAITSASRKYDLDSTLTYVNLELFSRSLDDK